MRVAINVEQLLQPSPGGIGRYTAQLAALLPGAGVDVSPFCARHPRAEVDATLAGSGVTTPAVVLPVPRRVLYEAWHTGSSGWLAPATVSRALAAADVVHAPSVATPPHGRTPLVVSVHDAAPVLHPAAFTRWGLRFHQRGLQAARARADVVITGSQVAADEVTTHAGIGADRIVVIPHGVDPRPPAPEVAAAIRARRGLADRPYVLWVGSLEPRKNVGTLVAAMARLARPRPARLVLAGFGGWLHDDLVDPRSREALGDDLVVVGPVDEDELWSLYAGAALVAVPSVHEGYGLPALEAMASAAPVVVSDIPVLAEVTAGVTPRVSPLDVTGWAEAIEGLLDDDAARLRLGAEGARAAAGRTVASAVAATADVYRRLVG